LLCPLISLLIYIAQGKIFGKSTLINDTDILFLIKASCDKVATGGLTIIFAPVFSTIEWTNINSVAGSLTFTNSYVGSPGLRKITCVD